MHELAGVVVGLHQGIGCRHLRLEERGARGEMPRVVCDPPPREVRKVVTFVVQGTTAAWSSGMSRATSRQTTVRVGLLADARMRINTTRAESR